MDGQYQHITSWEFVGNVRLNNEQGFVSFALNKLTKVRIINIKRAGKQKIKKEKYIINIMHRVIKKVEKNEEPAEKKSRSKGKAKATRLTKR